MTELVVNNANCCKTAKTTSFVLQVGNIEIKNNNP